MAVGVENASIVCCFMTPHYQESVNCKLELEYAQSRCKRIIPCMLGKKTETFPSGWLGIITRGGLNYIAMKDDSEDTIRSKAHELIDRIIQQSSVQASKQNDEPTYLYELIKYQYLRNSRIQRILNSSQSVSIEDSYINLSIVDTKEQQQKEKKLRDTHNNATIINTFEEIYGTKTAIDMKDLFQTCKDQMKQVLVLGRAGIGKSTFCRYAAYQWANRAIWSEYDLVLLLPLRFLTTDRYPPGTNYTLVDLVKREYLFNQVLSEKERQILTVPFDKSKVLWLLDGYDEIAGNVPPHLENLKEQLLQTTHHILTSRPYAITLSYGVKMEIIGFTDDNVTNYVQQFFESVKDELEDASVQCGKLLTFLKQTPSIWGVAHIPVNLELICSLWCNREWSDTESLTMTVLYDKMSEWLCRRYLTKKEPKYKNLVKDEVYEYCKSEMTFLETLAFEAMKNKDIILKPTLLRNAERNSKWSLFDHPELLNIGILKSLNDKAINSDNDREKNHYFLHLSFQEYFAARYLVNTLMGPAHDNAIDFIKRKKYNQRFALMFCFVSGLLIESDNEQYLDKFWNAILGEPLDLVGLRHVQIVISCFEETGAKENFNRRSELIDYIINWIKYAVATNHNNIHRYIEDSLTRSASIVNQPKIIQTLTQLLSTEDLQKKKNVVSLISKIPIQIPHPQLILLLVKALGDKEYAITSKACEALGNMGKTPAAKDVIDALLKVLGDQDSAVRSNAYIALGNIGKVAATKDVIDTLVKALEDQNTNSRWDVSLTLGNMGEKAATKDVIDALVKLFVDQDSAVGKNACEALGKMGEKSATKDLIDALVKALEDQNSHVRRNACKALEKMGKNAATKDVINALVKALEDQDLRVRRKVCAALGSMGEKAAVKEVIDSLVKALEHQDSHVRRNACNALEKMGDNAATEDVIDALMKALQDKDSDVGRNAFEALEKMGEKVTTKEMIDALVKALGNQSENVARNAREALEKMGEKIATKDVIDALLEALGDQRGYVRLNACIGLRNIGEKAAIKEVIDALVKVLGDQYMLVSSNACEALGKMGEKAATKDVINALVKALVDQSETVSRSACEALDKMGEKVATEDVIDALMKALGDQRGYVKKNACKALGNMGEKAATKEVIDALMKVLGDQDEDFSSNACVALGKMGEKSGTKNVTDALVKALGNEDWCARCDACSALGNIGEDAAIKTVIDALVKTLEDENENVRVKACKTMEKMGEKVATKEVIDALAKTLGDQCVLVRWQACDTLGNMGEKAASKEVIDALVKTLVDQDMMVRSQACEALGNMGEKAATKDVIDTLVKVLGDQKVLVRSKALRSLGKMGEKAATKHVIEALVIALGDQDSDLGRDACKALERMGEKAATNDVINGMLIAKNSRQDPDELESVLQKILTSCMTMSLIDSKTASNLLLYLIQNKEVLLNGISMDKFIKVYVDAEIAEWMSVVTLLSLRRECAITFSENTITVYENEDPVEFNVPLGISRERLVEAFSDQRSRHYLSSEEQSEYEHGLKVTSVVCNIM